MSAVLRYFQCQIRPRDKQTTKGQIFSLSFKFLVQEQEQEGKNQHLGLQGSLSYILGF